MAKQLKTHNPVDDAWLAGVTPTLTYQLEFPVSVVWNALLDGPAWTEWLPLDSVEWTSPRPFGVGTTRTVRLGNDVIEETFFGWEDGRRMAFRFEASTLPLTAAVEDYRLVQTATGCELQWTFKVSAFFLLRWILAAKLKSTLRKGLPRLEAMLQAHPGRFADQSDSV